MRDIETLIAQRIPLYRSLKIFGIADHIVGCRLQATFRRINQSEYQPICFRQRMGVLHPHIVFQIMYDQFIQPIYRNIQIR